MGSGPLRRWAAASCAALGVTLAATTADAATIPVTTTSDAVANDTQCSLREAIAAVNTPGSVGSGCAEADDISNTIVLGPHEYDLTIHPDATDAQETGDLDVNATSPPLTIQGVSASQTQINGAGLNDRIMHVLPGASVTISGLTITKGHAPDGIKGQDGINNPPHSTDPTPGTAGFSGGGIRNGGTLTLTDVAVTNNTAGSGGQGGVGLTLAQGASGGAGGAGGGIQSSGTLMLNGVTVSGNFAGDGGTGGAGGGGGSGGTGAPGGCCGDGGGLANVGGTVTIADSTFSANHAGKGGNGGAGADGSGGVSTGGGGGQGQGGSSGGAVASDGGTVTITNSTLSANFSGAGGNGGNGGSSTGIPTNTPLANGGGAGNGSTGGGVFASAGGTVTLLNLTVDGNRVGGPGTPGTHGLNASGSDGAAGLPASGGGVDASTTPAIALANSVLADNELGNCGFNVSDGGHNISFGDSNCPGTGFLRGDPKLGALHDNGGSTETEALGPGSAALDQLPASGASCPKTDQRGVGRPSGAACDIGAYEVTPPSVGGQTATGITATGATLSGSVTANAGTATVQFEFGTTTAYGSTATAAPVAGLSPRPASARLTGLTPNTTYHYALLATSADGSDQTTDATFTTASGPQQSQPPKLSKLTVAIRQKRATVSYDDSEAASTKLVVLRRAAGIKSGKRCVKPSKRAHGRNCTRLVKVGGLTHTDAAGANTVTFRRKLKPGRYKLTATATLTGLTGKTVTKMFRVRRKR